MRQSTIGPSEDRLPDAEADHWMLGRDAERELVGAVLQYGAAAVQHLPADFDLTDVSERRYQLVLEVALELHRAGLSISPTLVGDSLEQRYAANGAGRSGPSLLQLVGGRSALWALWEAAAPVPSLAGPYAEMIQRHAAIRRQRGIAGSA